MKIKFAKDIIKEIEERGPIQVSENCVTGEEFENWLIEENNINKINKLCEKYKKTWGKEIDYSIIPKGMSQEKLIKCLELMIEDNLSLIVAYSKLFKNKNN